MVKQLIQPVILLIALTTACTAQATFYRMPTPENDVVGRIFIVKAKQGDSLIKIGKQYGIGYHEMLEANNLHRLKRLQVGQSVIVPAQYILPPQTYRKGIVINLAELRLYYFDPQGKYVITAPVGLGREGWRTPTGKTYVVRKEENPIWHVPESIREYTLNTKDRLLPEEVPPGPENPLGKFALYLGKPGYLIHGTNAPDTVGKLYSSGCIRMSADDIKNLFQLAERGTPVYIINHSLKTGWLNGNLYLESHVPVSHQEDESNWNHVTKETIIYNATQWRHVYVNWDKVNIIVKQRRGIPEEIGPSNWVHTQEQGNEIHN